MKKEAKTTAIAELAEKFGRAKLAILTESAGIPVNQVTVLRRQLRAAKAEYSVIKNTLAARASAGTILAGLKAHFKGPTGDRDRIRRSGPTREGLAGFHHDGEA